MSDSGTPSSSNRRKRTGKPRSRKGCKTCKIRHVKCGEEKPECSQCTLTGRKCDGYTAASQRQLHQAIIKSTPRHLWSPCPDRNIVLVPGTWEERQYVQFFCTQTAHALSGFFPSDFWTKFLPQLSHRNPAVRHAVIAVGALHQRQLQGRLLSAYADPREDDEFALQQYNKAIRKFLQQVESPTEVENESMLIQCVLFICLEMLRGNTKQAMDHVEGGLRMLSRQLQDNKIASQSVFGRDLSQFFYRQNIQLSYFGRQLVPFTATVSNDFAILASNEDLVFENINQARDCLTNVITRVLCLIRSVQSHIWTIPQKPLCQWQLQHQLDLLGELDTWFKAFQTLRKKPANTIRVLDSRAPLSILCQYYAAVTWLSTCTSLDEMNFDHFYPYFEAIVSAGEKLVELCAKDAFNSTTEQFVLDAEVIPVLYWAVMRCRHPNLRRRGMHALTKYLAREGMWDKRQHLAIARRFMELEEAALAHLPVEQRLPAAHHRVYDAMICREISSPSNSCTVLFRSKPHGIDGPWEHRWEQVTWERQYNYEGEIKQLTNGL